MRRAVHVVEGRNFQPVLARQVCVENTPLSAVALLARWKVVSAENVEETGAAERAGP
ncbi:hypothetical protein PI124_g20303 [Phytophthora idaei]|nr:hypothetical protein PI126_g17641 [Phytophthora idaei]KAG3234649.1 hypothetical protein PI124_g20303 [Phytophthora idaei]